jgi:hypothetical protein
MDAPSHDGVVGGESWNRVIGRYIHDAQLAKSVWVSAKGWSEDIRRVFVHQVIISWVVIHIVDGVFVHSPVSIVVAPGWMAVCIGREASNRVSRDALRAGLHLHRTAARHKARACVTALIGTVV